MVIARGCNYVLSKVRLWLAPVTPSKLVFPERSLLYPKF